MKIEHKEFFRGNKIEILEMILKNADNQLELSWKIIIENTIHRIMFYNVSRFRIEEMSMPLEIHGFEIIDHTQNGWQRDSAFEIRDFEENRVHFFCEFYNMNPEDGFI